MCYIIILLSILTHACGITTDHGVGAPGHVQDIVDGINATEKWFISMLMENVKLPGYKRYEKQMEMYTTTHT